MSKHSKCSIRVYSSSGQSWTTKRGARRLIDRGLALQLGENALQMVEADYRYLSESQAAGRPQFDVAPYKHPRTVKVLIPLGYLRYPEGGAEAIRRSIRRTA